MISSCLKATALTAAAAIVCVFAGAPTASADPTVEFRGEATMTFSAACAEYGWKGKAKVRTRFRPPGVGGNDASTRLAFHFDNYATSFVLAKGQLGPQFKKVIGGGTGSQTFFYAKSPSARLMSLSPSTITTTTKTVKMSGEIQGFDQLPACTATFSATLQKS